MYDWKGNHKEAVKNKWCNGCDHIKTMPCWNGLSSMTYRDNNGGECPKNRTFEPITFKAFKKLWDSFWNM